jgi:hypothetical protein
MLVMEEDTPNNLLFLATTKHLQAVGFLSCDIYYCLVVFVLPFFISIIFLGKKHIIPSGFSTCVNSFKFPSSPKLCIKSCSGVASFIHCSQ